MSHSVPPVLPPAREEGWLLIAFIRNDDRPVLMLALFMPRLGAAAAAACGISQPRRLVTCAAGWEVARKMPDVGCFGASTYAFYF